ncbi:hypothetical protein B0T14DRAFT_533111 [Immersiella caudata]|uniref:Uncharacterized protein n=1 Tax=Immersiella caudata TaxID=314043 RepID=A0AA39XG91_9PEZI|nr:hypothetical protein B0T14DRAFT_533111 [Immersiella caudata]
MCTQRHDLVTAVSYFLDRGDGEPPTPIYVGSTQVTNERPMISTKVTVTDVTGKGEFTLESHGFAFHKHVSKEKGFHDEVALRAEYYPECEELLKSFTGASQVVAFDHKVRRGPAYWHKLGENNSASRGPLRNAHVDQSYEGALIRLREVLSQKEAEEVQKGRRWQIVNVWRPIKPIRKDPLAVADATSVDDEDLVAASIIYACSGRRMESWTVKANPKHRWYFKYGMRPDEVVLIKCFDSDETAVARRVPHCAVEDPDETEAECRESVEVRCMLFY